MFHIGATLLEIGTLEHSQEFFRKDAIDHTLMVTRTASLANNYSNAIVNLIWEMLAINPSTRIKAEELHAILVPY
jgi:hypothetical protein